AWSDLGYAFLPNGRVLDNALVGTDASLQPVGILKSSLVKDLYGDVKAHNYTAPAGSRSNTDLTAWYQTWIAGEPYSARPQAQAGVKELTFNHSAIGLDFVVKPAPTLIANGFTDDLFPVDQALRWVNRVQSQYPDAIIAQLYGDFCHQRADQ